MVIQQTHFSAIGDKEFLRLAFWLYRQSPTSPLVILKNDSLLSGDILNRIKSYW